VSSPRPRHRPRRRRRRVALAAVVALAFLAGIGLGEALRDGPRTGSQTLIRTLRPLPLVPIDEQTVTVHAPGP